jgi:hypothetical protein
MSRPGRKRLAVDIPLHIHKKIEEYAKKRNITITTWVLRACYTRLQRESVVDECNERDRKNNI